MYKSAVVFLIAIVTAQGFTLGADADQAVEAAEKNWAAAVVAMDFSAMEKIYSKDLIYAHSTGVVETKTEYLDKLKTGAQKYDRIDLQKSMVKLFGDSAVAHSVVRMSGNSSGEPFDSKLIMIHVWVKQDGHWRLVAHQTTKLEDL